MERNRGQIKEGEITLGRETLKLTSSPSKISSFSEFTTFSLPFWKLHLNDVRHVDLTENVYLWIITRTQIKMNGVTKSCTKAKRFEQSVTSLKLRRDKQNKKYRHHSLPLPHYHHAQNRSCVIKTFCNIYRFSLNFLILKMEALFPPSRPYPLTSPGNVLIPFQLSLPCDKFKSPQTEKVVRFASFWDVVCVRVPSPSRSSWFTSVRVGGGGSKIGLYVLGKTHLWDVNSDPLAMQLVACSIHRFDTSFQRPNIPQWATACSLSRLDDHTHTHTHTLGRTPLDERPARCRDLYLTKYNNNENKDILAAGRIRTRNPSRPEASDPRVRPSGHCDRPASHLPLSNRSLCITETSQNATI